VNELANIASAAAGQELPFLLSGGHAVISHGFARSTFDLDLIVRRSDREKWLQLVRTLGYVTHREGTTFLQFNAPDAQSFPLDLLLVNEETFSKMRADAVPTPSRIPGVGVVSLMHLLALKCHAIKYGHAGRIVKDADDVIHLLQRNGLDPNEPTIRELFSGCERKNSMKKSAKPATATNSIEFEFPDWSGMDDSFARDYAGGGVWTLRELSALALEGAP
jgi:hypothetical protein